MYLVVFRNRKRAGLDQARYAAEAEAMEALARVQPGYVAFKSYEAADGEVVSLSEWADEGSARAWGKVAEHRAAQARGREHYYGEYTMFGCSEPRVHRFSLEPFDTETQP